MTSIPVFQGHIHIPSFHQHNAIQTRTSCRLYHKCRLPNSNTCSRLHVCGPALDRHTSRPHTCTCALTSTIATAPSVALDSDAARLSPPSLSHVDADEEWRQELKLLLQLLPARLRSAADHPDLSNLIEVVMDLGRQPFVRFQGPRVREEVLSQQPITRADLQEAIGRCGAFDSDNRAGVDRTLHRISCLRNRQGCIVGLTCRVGRCIPGAASLVCDYVRQGRSILLLGRPGVGKTTAVREICRLLADVYGRRVVVVDTSNEIGGDGDVPHPGIGAARRMQVSHPLAQHRTMIEAVENHTPQAIVIDEIGTEAECFAARTIAQRGVQLVATAHGDALDNVLKNPSLADIVGGITCVTLGDEMAKKRGVQKTMLERAGPPTFDVAVEMLARGRWRVHEDVAGAVDALLAGHEPVCVRVSAAGHEPVCVHVSAAGHEPVCVVHEKDQDTGEVRTTRSANAQRKMRSDSSTSPSTATATPANPRSNTPTATPADPVASVAWRGRRSAAGGYLNTDQRPAQAQPTPEQVGPPSELSSAQWGIHQPRAMGEVVRKSSSSRQVQWPEQATGASAWPGDMARSPADPHPRTTSLANLNSDANNRQRLWPDIQQQDDSTSSSDLEDWPQQVNSEGGDWANGNASEVGSMAEETEEQQWPDVKATASGLGEGAWPGGTERVPLRQPARAVNVYVLMDVTNGRRVSAALQALAETAPETASATDAGNTPSHMEGEGVDGAKGAERVRVRIVQAVAHADLVVASPSRLRMRARIRKEIESRGVPLYQARKGQTITPELMAWLTRLSRHDSSTSSHVQPTGTQGDVPKGWAGPVEHASDGDQGAGEMSQQGSGLLSSSPDLEMFEVEESPSVTARIRRRRSRTSPVPQSAGTDTAHQRDQQAAGRPPGSAGDGGQRAAATGAQRWEEGLALTSADDMADLLSGLVRELRYMPIDRLFATQILGSFLHAASVEGCSPGSLARMCWALTYTKHKRRFVAAGTQGGKAAPLMRLAKMVEDRWDEFSGPELLMVAQGFEGLRLLPSTEWLGGLGAACKRAAAARQLLAQARHDVSPSERHGHSQPDHPSSLDTAPAQPENREVTNDVPRGTETEREPQVEAEEQLQWQEVQRLMVLLSVCPTARDVHRQQSVTS